MSQSRSFRRSGSSRISVSLCCWFHFVSRTDGFPLAHLRLGCDCFLCAARIGVCRVCLFALFITLVAPAFSFAELRFSCHLLHSGVPVHLVLHVFRTKHIWRVRPLCLTIRCRQQPLPLPVVIDFMRFVCHCAFQRPARRLCLSSGR